MQHSEINGLLYKFILVIGLLIFPFRLSSQSDSVQYPAQFLFPRFSVGIIKLKKGEDIALMLNYNIVTERMVFFQKSKQYDMTDYETVDTIIIQRRKFIPYGRVFYEVMVNAPVSFFVQHRGSVLPAPKPAAFGGTSEVSSSTYMSRIDLGNDVFRMKNKPEIRIKVEPLYWIRKNNEMFSFLNERQLLKVFPDEKNEIRLYIRQNHLDVEKPSDVIRIVNYYNGFQGELKRF